MGNLTRKQDRTTGARTEYTWDAWNRLTRVARYADATTTVADDLKTYTYGPLGRRWSRTDNGQLQRFVYAGQDRILTRDSTNTVIERVTHGTRIDEPLGIETAAGQRYLHGDRLGSIVAVTGSTTLDASYAYSPYGQTLDGPASALSPFRYTAREYEADDLYYYRARYYDPPMRRFLSEDPIGFAGGDANLYRYVFNNPLGFTDPNGEFAWIGAGAIIGAVINVSVTYIANGGNVTGQQLAAAAISGAISGAIGAAAGPLGGSIAKGLGLSSTGLVSTAGAGVVSAAGGAAGQAAANIIDPCNAVNPLNAALWGGIGGGLAKGLFPTKNLNTWAQASTFGPKTLGGLFGSSNAWTNNGAFATSSGVGAAANFPSINPF